MASSKWSLASHEVVEGILVFLRVMVLGNPFEMFDSLFGEW